MRLIIVEEREAAGWTVEQESKKEVYFKSPKNGLNGIVQTEENCIIQAAISSLYRYFLGDKTPLYFMAKNQKDQLGVCSEKVPFIPLGARQLRSATSTNPDDFDATDADAKVFNPHEYSILLTPEMAIALTLAFLLEENDFHPGNISRDGKIKIDHDLSLIVYQMRRGITKYSTSEETLLSAFEKIFSITPEKITNFPFLPIDNSPDNWISNFAPNLEKWCRTNAQQTIDFYRTIQETFAKFSKLQNEQILKIISENVSGKLVNDLSNYIFEKRVLPLREALSITMMISSFKLEKSLFKPINPKADKVSIKELTEDSESKSSSPSGSPVPLVIDGISDPSPTPCSSPDSVNSVTTNTSSPSEGFSLT